RSMTASNMHILCGLTVRARLTFSDWNALMYSCKSVIALFSRNHTTQATTRISDVTVITRNQMAVHVHHRLPRSAATVHADIVTVRPVLLVKPTLRTIDQISNCRLLIGGKIKPVDGMPPRNYQEMPWRYREFVLSHIGKGILEEHTISKRYILITERT